MDAPWVALLGVIGLCVSLVGELRPCGTEVLDMVVDRCGRWVDCIDARAGERYVLLLPLEGLSMGMLLSSSSCCVFSVLSVGASPGPLEDNLWRACRSLVLLVLLL